MRTDCPVCGDAIDRVLIKDVIARGSRYDILRCDRCGVGRTSPVPRPEELAGMYATGGYRTGEGRRFRGMIEALIVVSRQQRRRRIEKYVKNGAVLDVGCGRGLFLDIMRRHGWRVAGVEIDREAADRASRSYGIEVIEEAGMPTALPDGHFDVVTIHHVLEHLPDPEGLIRECARVLKGGGLLVVNVPNLQSLQATFGKGAWFHLDPPFHLYHFSEEGLGKLLQRHRFTVRMVRRFDWEYDVFGWLQTLLNRIGLRRNALYDFLKSREIGENRSGGRPDESLFLSFLLFPLLVPVSLSASLVDSFLLGKGGTVEVHAFLS